MTFKRLQEHASETECFSENMYVYGTAFRKGKVPSIRFMSDMSENRNENYGRREWEGKLQRFNKTVFKRHGII
jgi:hypothetical protein